MPHVGLQQLRMAIVYLNDRRAESLRERGLAESARAMRFRIVALSLGFRTRTEHGFMLVGVLARIRGLGTGCRALAFASARKRNLYRGGRERLKRPIPAPVTVGKSALAPVLEARSKGRVHRAVWLNI